MKNQVKVSGDEAGNVIIVSKNNKEWGSILVTQERTVIDDGFARKKTVAAFIAGEIPVLEGMGLSKGDELKGTIIFKERLKPFNPKDPSKDHKIAGDSGVVCSINGKPIYRKSFFVEDADAEDQELPKIFTSVDGKSVSHTNSEEIRAAHKAKAAAGTGLGSM